MPLKTSTSLRYATPVGNEYVISCHVIVNICKKLAVENSKCSYRSVTKEEINQMPHRISDY